MVTTSYHLASVLSVACSMILSDFVITAVSVFGVNLAFSLAGLGLIFGIEMFSSCLLLAFSAPYHVFNFSN